MLFIPFSKNAEITHSSQCVKSVRIRRYSGQHFPAFGLNMERYGVSLRIQSEYGKMRTRITPNTDTFYEVIFLRLISQYFLFPEH